MIPPTITLTGLDERTSVGDAHHLLASPFVEVAFLLTASPEGRNRYPSLGWLERMTIEAAGRCAVHVCGRGARAMLMDRRLAGVLAPASRIQVNGLLTPGELDQICALYPDHTIIAQYNETNSGALHARAENRAYLVDGSGGRGIAPASWVRPDVRAHVGFAGGLSAETMPEQLDAIVAASAGNPFWVDLENKLRTDDWFDVAKAVATVNAFEGWLERNAGLFDAAPATSFLLPRFLMRD